MQDVTGFEWSMMRARTEGRKLEESGKREGRFGLVANDEIRIAGLKALLEEVVPCEIVLLPAAGALKSSDLDLVLLDASSTDNVLELLATFRRLRGAVDVIVLGPETELDHVERIIGAGAKGYLPHAASEAELRMAIDVVRDGSVWAPRKVLARLLESSRSGSSLGSADEVQFTKREQEVLRLLVLGRTNRELAAVLALDEGTVKAHLGRLMRKASVKNRTALTIRAIEQKWV